MAAGQGFKTFITGEVLTAADTNGYLMQGVLVFADATARDAAITSPQEGQFAYLKDTNVTTYYTGSAWANLDTTGMTNPMTTTGDTIYSSSGSTPARLGIGSTGQVLTVAGGVPSWATPASGGGMTLLSTTTLSGSTTTISSISGSYKSLVAIIYGVQFSGSPNALWINPNGSSSISDWCGVRNPTSSMTAGVSDSRISTLNNIESGGNNSFYLKIDNYASTASRKPFQFYGQHLGANPPTGYSCTWAGGIKTTSAITSLQFDSNSQNFNAGTVLLYGVS